MSMICQVLALTEAQVSALKASPALADDVARAADSNGGSAAIEGMLARLPEPERSQRRAEFLAALAKAGGAERAAELAAAQQRVAAIGPLQPALDLEKAWSVLHYAFTGHADAAAAPGNELLSGHPLGEGFGYGPPMLQGVTETRTFAAFLDAQNLTRLAGRIDVGAMQRAGVYGMPMGPNAESDDADLKRELAAYFPLLKGYVAHAASRRDGLLIWLS